MRRNEEQVRKRAMTMEIGFSLNTSPHNQIFCRICKAREDVRHSNEFQPVTKTVLDNKGRMKDKVLKTPHELVKFFQEEHWERCIKPKYMPEKEGSDEVA